MMLRLGVGAHQRPDGGAANRGWLVLGLLGRQVFPHPGLARRRRERLRLTGSETVGPHNRVECRPAGSPFLVGAPRQLACGLPCRIGFDRTTTGDELGQHRAIHPGTGEKPRPNYPALRAIRAQRPRPHMRGCALRALTCMRLAPTRLHQLRGRYRFTVVGVTHLHVHTIRPISDNPDLLPRPT